VVYAQLKYLWATDPQERGRTINNLRLFADDLARDVKGRADRLISHPSFGSAKLDDLSQLLAKCYLKLGEWQVDIGSDWGEVCTL
jgi:FKBP12-rapamycin complex-associated protein